LLLAKSLLLEKKGDNNLLMSLKKYFETKGYIFFNWTKYCKELFSTEINLTKIKPSKNAILNLKKAKSIYHIYKKLDVGQAMIIQNQLVLGLEAIEGTDELLKRCKEYKRKDDNGVLFKFSKQDIRDISRALGFPWWDKPAQPCLSSRFPYGNEITSERLKMVEKAEEYLKECGLSEVRVRCQGSTARIEIPQDELKHFFIKYNFSELVQYFSNLGFNCTSLDLEGLVSGKLNR